MKRVWLVLKDYDYEGWGLPVAVFKTSKQAAKHADYLNKQEPSKYCLFQVEDVPFFNTLQEAKKS